MAVPVTMTEQLPPTSPLATSITEPSTPHPPAPYPQPLLQPSSHPQTATRSSQENPKNAESSSDRAPEATLPAPKLLSTYLVEHPTHSVQKAINRSFRQPNPFVRLIRRFKVKHSVISGLTESEMVKWEKNGKELRQRAGWKLEGEDGEGAVVSDLFWKMYISLLPTLERDPLSGLVPPDLLGSTTTMPLSIISLIPDIMQHYRDVIVRAEKEVFLATNYWQPSNSVSTISQSLKDLSARVLKENRPKVVVKIMYDRGSWEQLWNAHAPVGPKEWKPLDFPAKEEVQGLDLEIVNFHKVLLGTFHAKFLVVDRKVALINSNNIQDRPNLELMSHFEGPIVDAFYEVALHSWFNRLSPPLPCMSTPYQPPRDKNGQIQYLFQDRNPYFDDVEIVKAANAARILLRRQTRDHEEAKNVHHEGPGERLVEVVRKVMDQQRQSLADWKPGEDLEARAQVAMKELSDFRGRLGLGMGNMMGSVSRGNSRGPSRRSSRERLRDVEKRPTLPAMSEAKASPADKDELPIKSSTYPLVHEPEGRWSFSGPAPHPGRDSDEHSSLSLDGHLVEEHEKYSRVSFAPLDVEGVDGYGRFLGEKEMTQSPNGSNLKLSEEASRTALTEKQESPIQLGSVLGEEVTVADSPRGRTMGRAADTVAVSDPLGASALPPPPKDSQDQALPLSAQDPYESGDRYEKVKKNLTVTLPPSTKASDDEIQPEGTGSRRMFQLSKKFNAGALSEAWATVEDSDELDSFRPHVVHAPHEPFPIAMACRKPHGFPGHHDIRNPQNAAWLAGFRYAKKRIFIQTPTLNARPIVRAVKQACRRQVDVVLLLDLGFNDKGESIPFQGGTNEEVVDRLYKSLRKEQKDQYLKVYWYTGKDQVRPLNAVKKQRNCHIKFAAYDDEVLIIGNGNQDSQSWFHSQEVNVMLNSKQIVSEMMDTLLSNQNTIQYGGVDNDGIWRDKEGHTLEHHGATGGGNFRGLSGFIAFAKTI